MTVSEFLTDYERRTNSHDAAQLAPVIAEDATYWFSDGSHRGREAILAAIDDTWATIQDEAYAIRDVEVVVESVATVVYRYTFHWSGVVDGEARSGAGRGTSIAVCREGRWVMLHEHLSR